MTDPSTYNEITDWANGKYGVKASPSLSAAVTGAPTPTPSPLTAQQTDSAPGMMGSTAAPAGSTFTPASTSSTWANALGGKPDAPAPALGSAPAPVKANVSDWYRSTLGRDGDAAGTAYWQKALDGGMDPQQAYAMFQSSGQANEERVKPTTWAAANAYTGPQSAVRSTPVDDWGRNVLGRELSPTELANWGGKFDQAGAAGGPAAVQKLYSEFLAANATGIKRNTDLAGASQINPGVVPRPGSPVAAPGSAAPPTPQANPGLAPRMGVTPLDLSGLERRNIDVPTQTVRGQLASVLAEDSPVLQQARQAAMTASNERGMLNSAMAVSGAQDAVIKSALQIATPDAGFYNRGADYNAAAGNQAQMWNAGAQNDFAKQGIGIAADKASQGAQLDTQWALAQQQDATARYNAERAAEAARYSTDRQADTNRYNTDQQTATSRWSAEMQSATSRYNTDASYRQQADSTKRSLVNNIIGNMDMSPDRKAAMLEQLGEGTSAKRGQDGALIPGTGLAGAVYVIDSVAVDLNFGSGAGAGATARQAASGAVRQWGG